MLSLYRPFIDSLFDERLFSRLPFGSNDTERSGRHPVRTEVFSSHEDDTSIELRTFIPKSVNPESIEVVLKDGVLTIRMTKTPIETPRKIKVKHE